MRPPVTPPSVRRLPLAMAKENWKQKKSLYKNIFCSTIPYFLTIEQNVFEIERFVSKTNRLLNTGTGLNELSSLGKVLKFISIILKVILK